jgi:hypothetical protein
MQVEGCPPEADPPLTGRLKKGFGVRGSEKMVTSIFVANFVPIFVGKNMRNTSLFGVRGSVFGEEGDLSTIYVANFVPIFVEKGMRKILHLMARS